jgi:hypothetical protein
MVGRGNGAFVPVLIDTHLHLVTASGAGAPDRGGPLRDDELDAVITVCLRRSWSLG